MTNRYHHLEDIQSAHFCRQAPSFAARNARRKGAKGDGIRYEEKFQQHMAASHEMYLPGPWILYVVAGRPFWCQPDGLHFDIPRGHITIFEVKLKHTPDSQRQLRGVYEPVIRRMFQRPAWGVSLIEVCKWFDPDIRYPEPLKMVREPLEHFSNTIGVHVWKP